VQTVVGQGERSRRLELPAEQVEKIHDRRASPGSHGGNRVAVELEVLVVRGGVRQRRAEVFLRRRQDEYDADRGFVERREQRFQSRQERRQPGFAAK